MLKLESDLLNEIVTLLLPHVDSERSRQELLALHLLGYPDLIKLID